jgi:CO/xanthine dehydrogenase FAD-binding subunit
MATETIVPATPEEAAELFGDGAGITVFAGGTILMPEIAAGRLKPTRALMLHRSGLAELRKSDGLVRIGAMVTVSALAEGDGLLARFAAEIGDAEVRRGATVGGNLCATPGLGSQRGDLGAPLIALGARVRTAGKGAERTEPVEDFLAGDHAGRLVLELEYDDVDRTWAAETMRRRHAHSYAIANVAVCSSGGGLRVAVSGTGPTAVRCRAVEQSREPEDVLEDVDPVDDAVATAAYRRRILPVLVRRALDQLESA